MNVNFIVKRGETLRLQLLRTEGDTSIVSGISAKLKKAGPNGSIPVATAPTIATFTTESITEGWNLIITDEETLLIEPGLYIADAKLALTDGEVIKTEAVLIRVDPSVT